MGEPTKSIVCSECKDVFDATTAMLARFRADAAHVIEGFICRDCGVSRLEAGILAEPIDRRTGGDDGVG